MRGKKRVAAATLVVGGFALSGALAYANEPTTGGGYGYGPHVTGHCKPGWGHGDKNHCHSGPPGLANKPRGQANQQARSGR